jgi:hypothetical protein
MRAPGVTPRPDGWSAAWLASDAPVKLDARREGRAADP